MQVSKPSCNSKFPPIRDDGVRTVQADFFYVKIKIRAPMEARIGLDGCICPYCWRRGGMGRGMLKVDAATPTPPSQEFGGQVGT